MTEKVYQPDNVNTIRMANFYPAQVEKSIIGRTNSWANISNNDVLSAGTDSFAGSLDLRYEVVDELTSRYIERYVQFAETELNLGTSRSGKRPLNLPKLKVEAAPTSLLVNVAIKDTEYTELSDINKDYGQFVLEANGKMVFEGSLKAMIAQTYQSHHASVAIPDGWAMIDMPVGDYPHEDFLDGLAIGWDDYQSLDFSLTKENLTGVELLVTAWLVSASVIDLDA